MSERVAVVTGASRGIGAGIAETFAGEGLRLGLCARSAPVLGAGPDVVARTLDVTDEAGVAAFTDAVIDRFGRIDLWINNAGVLDPIAPLREITLAEWRQHTEINLDGVFLGSRAFVRHLHERGGDGVLINVSSGAARKPYHGWSAYCAGKAGVDRMTECLDREEREHGLRAYSIAPGVVDTDMQALIRETSADAFADVERFRQRKEEGDFNSARFVAEQFLQIAFDPAQRPAEVCVTLPDELR
jgi:NAD(P)-dependent dehydrogenase (short-subunit alcohol dehydrogenase family)